MEKELKKEIFLAIAYLIGALVFFNIAMVEGSDILIVVEAFIVFTFLIFMMISVVEIIFYYETRDLSFKAKQRLFKR